MADTELLRKAIYNFEFYSSPSNTNSNSPCTVGDLKKVIENTANVLNVFVEELEKK